MGKKYGQDFLTIRSQFMWASHVRKEGNDIFFRKKIVSDEISTIGLNSNEFQP